MKKLLFPTEFSPNVNQNFLYALDWAKKLNTPLVMMHALGLSDADKTGKKDWTQTGSEFMDKMIQFVEEQLPKEYKSVKIEYIVELGFPADAIEKVAEEENIEMIVMGMRAHPTALEAYFSSVSMDIISRVNIPVLLIPDTNKFEPIENMTYTFNFDFKELVVITKLLKLGKKVNTTLKCFHVAESDENLEVLEFQFSAAKKLFKNHKKYGDHIEFDMSVGDFEEVIKYASKEDGIDLLVMLSHKRNFKTRFMQPSTASKVARKMDIPVLILKESYIFSRPEEGTLEERTEYI